MKIAIAAGGTGGHIYPALSLAEAFIDKDINTKILFIGTANHMEADVIPNAGYDFKTIKVSGLSGGALSRVLTVYRLYKAVNDATIILKEFKPDAVWGFGGYVSAPVVIAAHKLKIPALLHEQNAYAGRANLFLEKHAQAVVVCYDEAYQQFRKKPVFLLGNPQVYQVKKEQPKQILKEYHLNKKTPIILMVMGSQGSKTINDTMIKILRKLNDKPYQIIYVTGKNHYESFINQAKGIDNIRILPFVKQTALLNHVSLMIARGGATTATELCAFGVPSIIIPSPFVPNNHQEVNAQALMIKRAAYMIRENELNEENLVEMIDKIIEDKDLRKAMSENAKSLSYVYAAEDMIILTEKVVNHLELK
ncbi:MAG: undecaprenyldiphospho-muramoylpentapeptide beta-N-acetylglucosaminyltransferase [Erysipelotrichaceae bacterium]|nr:undecaprenyldiphospho-muramoylpentapeptide beta-N-acetylglucosaminyltransferase [Erysipelotrichaceae bacterium]